MCVSAVEFDTSQAEATAHSGYSLLHTNLLLHYVAALFHL